MNQNHRPVLNSPASSKYRQQSNQATQLQDDLFARSEASMVVLVKFIDCFCLVWPVESSRWESQSLRRKETVGRAPRPGQRVPVDKVQSFSARSTTSHATT